MPEVGLHLHRDPITSRVVWHESQGHGSQGEARLYIADAGGHRVIEAALSVAPDGWPSARLLRVFGDGESGLEDSDATTARFAEPVACCRGGDLLWVADRGNHALRVIDLVDGRVGTAAGNGRLGDGGHVHLSQPLSAALPAPVGVASVQGAILFSVAESPRIWAYLPEVDRVGPLVGSGRSASTYGDFAAAGLVAPAGLVAVGVRLLIADAGAGQILVADLATRQLSPLKAGHEAALCRPVAVAPSEHHLFVVDAGHRAIVGVNVEDGSTEQISAAQEVTNPRDIEAFGQWLLVADGGADGLKSLKLSDRQVRPLRLQTQG